jgi:hypothetical protein
LAPDKPSECGYAADSINEMSHHIAHFIAPVEAVVLFQVLANIGIPFLK